MVYNLYIQFEYDLVKSNSNKLKHGIDFEECKELWKDEDLLQIQALSNTEPRYLIIGKLNNKHWSVVVTYRRDRTRIISARRSSKSEIQLYEEEKDKC